MGSKSRIAKEILPVILKNRKEGQYYVEPFCGGCNSLYKVSGNRIASDINKYLIAMWQGLQNDNPRSYDIDKKMYDAARSDYNRGTNDSFSDFELGWIGWMGSFNGRFFDGGYSGRRDKRDYIREQISNTEKQVPCLKDVVFFACDYSELIIPENSIIYCDIPYMNTKRYAVSRNFDYEKFWHWCSVQKSMGHEVFVSEYAAPSGIECVWSKQVTNSLNTKLTKKPIEKLFRL